MILHVGDNVSHPDFPGSVGVVDKVAYIGRKSYYSVTWPWRAAPGPNILYSVESNPLTKA